MQCQTLLSGKKKKWRENHVKMLSADIQILKINDQPLPYSRYKSTPHNPGPAEPGYVLSLQTADSDQLAN